MKRKLTIGGGIALAVLAVLGILLWRMMMAPLYRPGMARAAGAIAVPASGHDAEFWNMEPDVRLYHFEAGSGSPVLVVHGGPGFPFRRQPEGLRLLSDRHRFIFYDQRGCGRSTRPLDRFRNRNYFRNVQELDGRLGIAAQLRDIERIRRILGGRQLVLLGHSFGALLSALYAAEFPENVKAMVLVAPADLLQMPAPDGGLFERVRERLPEKMRPAYAAYLARLLDFRSVFAHSEAELRERHLEFAKYYAAAAGAAPAVEAEAGGWMNYALYFGLGMRHDWRGAMRAVEAPVLVVHGAADLQSEHASRAFAACFPKARVSVIAGAGHWPFADRPAEFAAAAGGFLGAL